MTYFLWISNVLMSDICRCGITNKGVVCSHCSVTWTTYALLHFIMWVFISVSKISAATSVSCSLIWCIVQQIDVVFCNYVHNVYRMSHFCIIVVFCGIFSRNTRGFLAARMTRQFVSGTGSLVVASGDCYDVITFWQMCCWHCSCSISDGSTLVLRHCCGLIW